MNISDARLLAWLSGALEPGDALYVQEAVVADAGLAGRAATLRARLAPPTRPRVAAAQRWRVPPPRVSGGMGLRRATAAVMSEALRAGERFRLRIDPVDRPDERLLVVLYRTDDTWEVVFPQHPDETVAVGALPAQDDGSRSLDLVARAAPRQRWAIALPLGDAAPDWDAPAEDRWSSLRRAIAAGEAPVASAEIRLDA